MCPGQSWSVGLAVCSTVQCAPARAGLSMYLGHMHGGCIHIYYHFPLCRRNDFISVVRNAARTALENMNIPEAKEVLQVTKVLEDEIESLAGNQAAV